jgi:hypothetical protein
MERLVLAAGGGGAGQTVGVKTPRLTSQAPGYALVRLPTSSRVSVALHGSRDELTGVELRVDGLDEPLLRGLLVGVLGNLEDDDAGDLLGLLAGALGEPADGDL